MQVTTLGIDLAENLFRMHGCDASGNVAVSKSLTRRQLQIFVATLPPCLVGMETCATAHYRAPEIQKHRHEVRNIRVRWNSSMVVNHWSNSPTCARPN